MIAPASASYSLDSGDVLEISIFGLPDFKRRVTVNIDGDVTVPFIGEVRATGLSIADFRKNLTQQLTESGSIRNPQVTVELIEHRPFFVSGDVAKPGALPYRPKLTVRHAIALAGGYDALRFRTENPVYTAPELKSQYRSLWMDLIRTQIHLASLKAEMNGKAEFELTGLDNANAAKSVVDQIIAIERTNLRVRLNDSDKERQFLERSIETLKAQAVDLEAASQKQSAAVVEQVAAIERASSNLNKGVVGVTRLDEERRALTYLQNQDVDIKARLALVHKSVDEFTRKLEKQVDDRQVRLLSEIENATVEVERMRNQIRASGEKLLYMGAVKAQMKNGTGPQITIYRRDDGGQRTIRASEDTDILPSDIIDILIEPENLLPTPSQ
jgi:polysaccharide export outer membrane protein